MPDETGAAPRPAAFLDRDGTLIEDRHYLADPDGVAPLPGAAAAVRALNDAGVAVVIVTNQSGIARGYFGEAEYARVAARVVELFAAQGARIDAAYHCPHHPSVSGPCGCRKPGLLLYERAAAEHALDPARSLFVGDRWRDVEPALAYGGTGVLVATPDTAPADVLRAGEQARVATTLAAAVDRFLGERARRVRTRIVVLASGGGSNLGALLEHLDALGDHRAGDVVAVATNGAGAGALARARARGVAAEPFDAADPDALGALLARHEAELVVLAGYLKLVPRPVTRAYRGRILNVHPALLPAFGGAGMYGARVHQAVIAAGARVTGATVHFVDEAYDRGPIAAQWPVPVFEEDTAETVAERVLRVEHLLLPRVVDAVAAGTLALDDDGRVRGAFLVGNPGDAFVLGRDPAALAATLDAALTR